MAIPARTRGRLRVLRNRSYAARAIALPVQTFIHTQGMAGILLLASSILALIWANSPWQETYFKLWHARISFDLGIVHLGMDLHHWINDGLMAVFFFLVGMEIKHELWQGELSKTKEALLPLFAALGGLMAPALIYWSLNAGGPGTAGWGIPMATDTAFALGVLALVGNVPDRLKIFLLALAIIDDIVAMLVIALFYTPVLHLQWLLTGSVPILLVLLLDRLGVRALYPYLYIFFGLFLWFCVLESGVHATIAGVIMGLLVTANPAFSRETFQRSADSIMRSYTEAIESRDYDRADAILGAMEALVEGTESPVERMTRKLHGWVGFLILPLFALANAGASLNAQSLHSALNSPVSWGIAAGLVIGKPVGILLATWIAVRLKMAEVQHWLPLAGVAVLAGIGFTVSIFIGTLAFEGSPLLDVAKVSILCASLVAGLFGFLFLRWQFNPSPGADS